MINQVRLGMVTEQRMILTLRVMLAFLNVVALFYAGFWFRLHDTGFALYSLATGVLSIALMGFPVFKLSLMAAARIVLFALLQFAYMTSAVTWSQSPIIAGYLLVFSLVSLIFLGSREGLFWTVVVAFLFVSLPWASTMFILPSQFASISQGFMIVNGLVILLSSFIAVYYSDSFQKTLLVKLSRNKKNLEDTQEKLLNVQLYRNRFFSSISHEIRTPMNAVRGIAELLKQNRSLPPEDVVLVESLYRSSTHLLGIINDLLDVGKLEENKFRFVEIDFDLREAIYDASTIVKYAATEKNLNFQLEIDPSLPKFIRCDRSRLRQILVNLLNNAVKFTNEGYVALRVQLRLSPETGESTLHLRIEDTGIGIAKEDQEVIFDGYVQGHGLNLSQVLVGTGLGLSICKRIIEAQGGRIWCNSTVGVGSTFYVDLPIKAVSDSANPAGEMHKDDWKIEQNLKVFLVDDNKINLLVAERQLTIRMPNAKFFQLENGKLALELINSVQPDIILMDMYMPILNGTDTTRQIRQLPDKKISAVPIIAMTANTSEEDVESCYAAGMNDFISKPFDVDDLLLKILRLCQK